MKWLALPIALCLATSHAHASKWLFKSETNSMTGNVVMKAMTISDNQNKMSFPYAGKNYSVLLVEHEEPDTPTVLFAIDRGQLMCPDCSVLVRFDEAPPILYSMTRASDNNPAMLYFSEPLQFLAGAATAKRIRIQFTAFHQGTHIADFKLIKPMSVKTAP